MSDKERTAADVADKGSRLKDLPIGRDSFEEIRYGSFYQTSQESPSSISGRGSSKVS